MQRIYHDEPFDCNTSAPIYLPADAIPCLSGTIPSGAPKKGRRLDPTGPTSFQHESKSACYGLVSAGQLPQVAAIPKKSTTQSFLTSPARQSAVASAAIMDRILQFAPRSQRHDSPPRSAIPLPPLQSAQPPVPIPTRPRGQLVSVSGPARPSAPSQPARPVGNIDLQRNIEPYRRGHLLGNPPRMLPHLGRGQFKNQLIVHL